MSQDLTLREVFETGYRPCRLRGASERTIVLWNLAFRWFERFLERPAVLSDFTDGTLHRFAAFRRDGGVTAATVNRDLFSLLALWRWCHQNGLVTEWPKVQVEDEPRRRPVSFSTEAFDSLLEAAGRLEGEMDNTTVAKRHWWTALLLTCVDSGKRVNSVLQLQWRDVQLDRGWILFRAVSRHGRRHDSIVSISGDTEAALHALYSPTQTFVFRNALTLPEFHEQIKPILADAGISVSRGCKFHWIRRQASFPALSANGGRSHD